MKTLFVVPVLLIAALFTQACSTAQITLSLQTAAMAAEVAVNSINPPTVGSQIAAQYIAEAADAIDKVGTILAGVESNASKGAAVTAALAGILSKDPHLATGTPQKVLMAVATLTQALRAVLATYGTPPPASPTALAGARAPLPTGNELAKASGAFKSIAKQARSTKQKAQGSS